MLLYKYFFLIISFVFMCFALIGIIKATLQYRKKMRILDEHYNQKNKEISDYYKNLREEVAKEIKIICK